MKIRNYSNLATVKDKEHTLSLALCSLLLSHSGHMHVKACFSFLNENVIAN